jgi:dUTP pyrophosphatase
MEKLMVCAEDGFLPQYAHEGDAGLDLRSTAQVFMPASGRATVGTGVRVSIPDGFVGLVFPRSGLACKQGIRLANCVGVIDSGYRGEILVTLVNDSEVTGRLVCRGDRIAQLVVMPYARCEVVQADSLDDTERGEDGYGSTGVK